MLNIVKRILALAGEHASKIKLAFIIGVFEGMVNRFPFLLVLYILIRIVEDRVNMTDVWLVGGGIAFSVMLSAVCKWLINVLQSGTGYEIFARERMKIGDRLKRLPMGYFSEGNKGNITAVVTSDLIFVEEYCMQTLSKIVTGYLSIILGIMLMMLIDYRLGLITLVTVLLAAFFLQRLERVVAHHSALRQEVQSRLIHTVLEYVKGISVIKAFNMVGEKAQKTNQEFRHSRDAAIDFEKKFIAPHLRFEHCFTFGIGLTILAASYFTFNQTLDLPFMLVVIIFIFELFLPFRALGGISAQVRIMEAALNRYESLQNIQVLDEEGQDIQLERFDIEFQNVNFAYEQENVLHQLSFHIPEKSMTALVGKSGCGKSTIVNLIARFWDVQEGEVKVGGVNVKEMTCDSLLKHISMVFQNVYLFRDTILNNIKFGKPDATLEEVIEACKKARCHDFIMELEQGYETVVDEAGTSLSGGQKQRISIARAILKDAPIILLDEATASIDPENERHIQEAINELVKDKTLVLIAHRLSTIKQADQILVLDEGRIVQKGSHAELIAAAGPYQEFWQRRMKARGWKIRNAAG